MKNKRGQELSTLQNVVLALVVIGFVIAISLMLMYKTREVVGDGNDTAPDTVAEDAVDGVIDAIDDVPSFLGIIVLAFVALVVIGVILLLQRNRA